MIVGDFTIDEVTADDLPPDAGFAEDAAERGPAPKPLRGLPVIEYAGGQLADATNEAEEILAESDKELFQRGESLVRIAYDTEIKISDGHKTKGVRLVPVEIMHMIDRMTDKIDFQIYDSRRKKHKSINAPRDVATALLQRKGLWRHLPVITGIVTSPTLRPDGSILDVPGYDEGTGILYVMPRSGIVYPAIPIEPMREQAIAALDTLITLINEFPFVLESGDAATGQPSPARSVALSMILTAMVRRSMATAPLHAFDATAPGTGKSKLVNIAAMIAMGHEAPAISGAGDNPEEFEKRLGTGLLTGDAILNFDNLSTPLGGDLLCSTLTESMVNIRILGHSKFVMVPNTSLLAANGNQLTIVGDMVRRALRSRLDARVEQPELRTFTGDDPVPRALRERPRYVCAALTVLRAFYVAGQPQKDGIIPLGSFDDWSRLIRGALIWLGEPDPCDTMERLRQENPKRRALADVLYWWDAVIGRNEVTAKRAVQYAEEREPPPERQAGLDFNKAPTPPAFRNPEFRDALMAVAAGKNGSIDPVRLGVWLRRNSGQFVDGLRFEPGLAVDHSGSGRWKVVSG